MKSYFRVALVGFIILSSFVLYASGLFASVDKVIGDARFQATSRPPSGETVFVEIDGHSLLEVGTWPWPRRLHARMIDALLDMGADQVALDIDFSSASNAEDDAALAAALERAGGYVFLAAFQQYLPAIDEVVFSQPLEQFAAHAQPVLVNVETGQTGAVVAATGGEVTQAGRVPSMASVLAHKPGLVEASHRIDFGIDLTAIDRVSAIEVLNGSVDPSRIAGKQVVIGASAIELRDFFTVPRFGTVPGPMVQLAATETLMAGRSLVHPGPWPALLLSIVAGIGALFLKQRTLASVLLSFLSLGVGSEVIALALLEYSAVLVPTSMLHLALLGLVAFRLTEQLRLEHRVRRDAQERLNYLAHHDATTGALSRQGLMAAIEARRTGHLLLTRLVDANTIRGALGQEVLNEVLGLAVRRLQEQASGPVARIGDQSLAVFTDTDCAAAGEATRVALERAYAVHRHVAHTRVAIAVAEKTAEATAEDVLSAAELALLAPEAKLDIAVYSRRMHERVERRRRLDVEMRSAIEQGHMHLVYQPQVRLSDEELVGAEALLRWSHPELGSISPAEFIPLAEETGLIVPIGAWVLEEACRTAALNPWIGRIGINVSGRQFQEPGLAARVIATVESTGLDARRLEIEVTEGVLSDDDRVRSTLETLRGSGIGISIDDFGTGFSSLSYLATLPFDTLKIDRSFVRDIHENTPNYRITKAIVDLATALGKEIIAEGMEDRNEAAILRALGCQFGQGYLFGKPLELAEFKLRFAATKSAQLVASR